MAADDVMGCVMETLFIRASDDEASCCELKFSHSNADESVSNTDWRSSTLIMSSHLSS